MNALDALNRNLPKFPSDRPCKINGHTPTWRYTRNDTCIMCAQNANTRYRERQLIKRQISVGGSVTPGQMWPSASVDITIRVHRDDIAALQGVVEALWLQRGFIIPTAQRRRPGRPARGA